MTMILDGQPQRPAHSTTDTTLVDEESPLLVKPPRNGVETQIPGRTDTKPSGDGQLCKGKILWIMSGVWIGSFVAGLDGTIMATLAAPIATEFNSLPLLAWLATAFLIGQAATQPLSGKLTDIFSRHSGLIVSSLIFATGNVICGFAREQWMMILGRLVAGVGGGCVNTIATILVSDLIPLRQRGVWQGFSNVFWGLGNGLGGVFGGYINDTWDWRVAFLAQVPFTAVSLVIVCCFLDTLRSRGPQKPPDGRPSISRIDFLGSFLLVSTLVLFLIGLTTGGNIVPWTHPLASVTLPLAAILFFCFIYVEQKVAREPVVPLHFLKNRTVLCACLTNWFFHMINYAFIFYLPIYYRIRGVSTTQAGAALIPFSVSLPLGSLVAGTIATKTGKYQYLLWSILVLMLVGAIASCTVTLETSLWLPRVYLGLVGLASGGVLIVTLLALLSSVNPSEQAVITSISYIFRSTGSVVGLCVASAVYQQVLEKDLWARLGGISNAAEIVRGIRDGLDYVDMLPPQLQLTVKRSYMVALRATFSTTVVSAALALVCGLMVRELRLPSTLGYHKPNDASCRKQDDESQQP